MRNNSENVEAFGCIMAVVLLRVPPVGCHVRSSIHPSLRMTLNLRSHKSSSSIASLSASTTNAAATETSDRKLPVLLFDIMSTVVRDPFYEDVPAFFGYHKVFNFFGFLKWDSISFFFFFFFCFWSKVGFYRFGCSEFEKLK